MAPWTWVDVARPLTFADYQQGRDSALAAALTYAAGPSIAEQLVAAARSGGVEEALQSLDRLRTHPDNRYADMERKFIRAVQALNRAGLPDAAIAVGQRTGELFPGSADAFFLVGAFAEQAKRGDVALAAARHALSIDPNHRNARSLLERLSSRTQ